jgi:hypothetical protein
LSIDDCCPKKPVGGKVDQTKLTKVFDYATFSGEGRGCGFKGLPKMRNDVALGNLLFISLCMKMIKLFI